MDGSLTALRRRNARPSTGAPLLVACATLLSLADGCSSRPATNDSFLARKDGGTQSDAATTDSTTTDDAASDDAASDDANVPACGLDETQSCYGGIDVAAGVGRCSLGTRRCTVLDDGTLGWTECLGWMGPLVETCGDGIDNDCDGATDEEPDGSPCRRDNADCWPAGTYICGGSSCGAPYEACWAGGCLDPSVRGNCCSYHFSTQATDPFGNVVEGGAHFCD